MVFVYMAVSFGLLVAGASLHAKVPPRLATMFWVFAPLALLPIWIRNAIVHGWSAFLWAKIFSVAWAAAFFAACRTTRISPRMAGWGSGAFLLLNMLEAILLDFSNGNFANTLAGVLVIAATPWSSAFSDGDGRGRDGIVADLSWRWVVAYTVWNFGFVYGNWQALGFGQHVPVLFAAIAIAVTRGRTAWLVARAHTLGLHLLVYATFFGWFQTEFNTEGWYSPLVSSALGLLAAVVAGRLLAQRLGLARSP